MSSSRWANAGAKPVSCDHCRAPQFSDQYFDWQIFVCFYLWLAAIYVYGIATVARAQRRFAHGQWLSSVRRGALRISPVLGDEK
jgi:hypothetical protein